MEGLGLGIGMVSRMGVGHMKNALCPLKVVGLTIIGMMATSCSKPVTQLIDGFSSYETVDQVRAKLKSRGFGENWKEDFQSARGSRYRPPAYIMTTLSGPYEDLGIAGELRLTFYNDRLMGTTFTPTDGLGYLAKLRERMQTIPKKPGERIRIHERTMFSYYTDGNGKYWFEWDDSTLENEWHDWVYKNA